jgi:hypothetical protein
LPLFEKIIFPLFIQVIFCILRKSARDSVGDLLWPKCLGKRCECVAGWACQPADRREEGRRHAFWSIHLSWMARTKKSKPKITLIKSTLEITCHPEIR